MSRPFFGGIPTKPDVEKLMDHFSVQEGDVIEHENIIAVIGVEPSSNRYRNVVNAWRKALLTQKNLLLVAIPSVGYKVLTPTERVAHGVDGFVKSGRRIRKNAFLLGLVPDQELSGVDRAKKDHVVRVSIAVLDSMSDGMKQIEPRKPDTLPRPGV